MKRPFCNLAASLLLGSLATSIAAQNETPDRNESVDKETETVVVPFAPEIGVDMLYEISRNTGDPKVRKVQQNIRFARSDGGYVMTAEVVSVSVNGEMVSMSPETEGLKGMSPFLGEISYNLAGDGTVLGLRDWEKLKQDLQSSKGGLRSAIKTHADTDGADKQVTDKVILFFSRMSSEQAANYFLKDWIPVLGYGGLELELDAEYEADTSLDFGGVPVPAKTSLGLSRDQSNGSLVYFEKTKMGKPDPEDQIFSDFEKLMAGMFEDDPQKSAQFQNSMKQLQGADINHNVHVQFDKDTGMPISFEGVYDVSLESGEGFKRTTTIDLISKQ